MTSSEHSHSHIHEHEGVSGESLGEVEDGGYYDETQLVEEVEVTSVGHRRQVINTLVRVTAERFLSILFF